MHIILFKLMQILISKLIAVIGILLLALMIFMCWNFLIPAVKKSLANQKAILVKKTSLQEKLDAETQKTQAKQQEYGTSFSSAEEVDKAIKELEQSIQSINDDKPWLFSWFRPGDYLQWEGRLKPKEVKLFGYRKVRPFLRREQKLKNDLGYLDGDRSTFDKFASTLEEFMEWVAHLLVLIFFGWIFAKLVLPAVQYFAFAPKLEHLAPIQLEPSGDGHVIVHDSKSQLDINIGEGETFFTRTNWASQFTAIHESAIFWNQRAKVASILTGLFNCSKFSRDAQVASRVTLSSPDPVVKIAKVDLDEGTRLVLRLDCIVAISSSIDVATRYRFSLLALLSGQFRFWVFSGPGSVVLQCPGGVSQQNLNGEASIFESGVVLGFEARLEQSMSRSKAFLHFLFGKKPLVQQRFSGSGSVIRSDAQWSRQKTAIEQFSGGLLSAIGKVIGI